jgi:DnaJ-class molecular chaperone
MVQDRPADTGSKPGNEDRPGSPQTGEALCPDCDGEGYTDHGECPKCGGTGRIVAIVGDA